MIIDFTPYLSCSDPYAHRSIMSAIVKVESGGNPWALNVNNRGIRLLAQPKTKEEAISWINWFDNHGYNIDIGIAQVNIKNIKKMNMNATDFLDPCLNLKVASQILLANYKSSSKQANNSDDAIKLAISAYNTGNFRNGFSNGYVQKVINKYYGVGSKSQVAVNQPPISGNVQPNTIKTKRSKYNNQQQQNNNSMKIDLWKRYDAPTNT